MKDSKSKRITEIEKRISWLRTELVHSNRYPGVVNKGFEEELNKLIQELEIIKK